MLIVGNWKMTPYTQKEVISRIKDIKTKKNFGKKVEVVVCPPTIFVESAVLVAKKKKINQKVFIGAQDFSIKTDGSWTGEIPHQAFKSLGIKYVIVGHSERRKMGESEDSIAQKIKNILESGLSPIICVGEDERDADGLYMSMLKKQITTALSLLKEMEIKSAMKKIVFAYEPVYAVGAKTALSTEEIHHSALFVRKVLNDKYGEHAAKISRVLYGGSVNAENAGEIVREGGVDGLLIGRASWKPKDFSAIIDNCLQ